MTMRTHFLTLSVLCLFPLVPWTANAQIGGPDDCPTSVNNYGDARALASEWFDRGCGYASEERYDDAAEAFACSNLLVPHPATLLNHAKALSLTDAREEAIAVYESFLETYPEHPKATDVPAEVAALRSGPHAPRSEHDVAISIAADEIVASQPDGNGIVSSHDSGTTVPRAKPPTAKAPPSRMNQQSENAHDRRFKLKTAGLTMVSAGVVGMITGIVFQVMASYNYLRLKDDLWLSEFESRQDKHERYQRTAAIALSISTAVCAGGLVVFGIGKKESHQPPAAELSLIPSPGGLSTSIRF